MTAKTGSWAGLVVSAGNLDGTTYGQGTTFPSSWDVSRLFWRSDLKRLYYNKGTEGSPIWEGADVPVGTINMYAGATTDVPSGWLLCDGSAVSRTTYAQLFAVLDTEYGTGDGSTTFNLPNFVTDNKFPRAATDDSGRGTTGGESTHTLTESEMPTHTHIQNPHSHDILKARQYTGYTAVEDNQTDYPPGNANRTYISTESTTAVNQNTGGDGAHENKPPFIDVHFIIAV